MRIGIIGGGSIGLLFSYYLSEHFDVTLYSRTLGQVESIHQNGIQLISNGLTHCRSVKSNTFDHWSGKEELTLIAVKQYHLNDIVKCMREQQSQDSEIVFLQNGMGHIKLLNKLSANTIYVSTVEHGANKKNHFTVEHNGIGLTKLAVYKGKGTLPDSIFTITDFPIVMESDYYEMLINKLIINAIINPITALLRVTNGEIIRNERYFSAAKNLFAEVSEILNLKNSESYFQQVVEVCQNTSENRSSMLKDIESHRPTEIDAIIGFILEEADRKKIQAPVCKMLYLLLKGSER